MSKNHGRSRETKDTSEDWVHDKFRADSPGRNEHASSNGSRRANYYDGHAMRRSTDSYKPALESNASSKDDTRGTAPRMSSYRKQGYLDNGRYSVDKPTVYHTLLETLVKKAYASGVSSSEFFDLYYWSGREAREDKPEGSAYVWTTGFLNFLSLSLKYSFLILCTPDTPHGSLFYLFYSQETLKLDYADSPGVQWLLWRQECLIWKQLFPEEGFIGAEPKLKTTLPDTETRNFSMMDSSKLWRILKASPEYGRLKNNNDRVSSAPNRPDNPSKQPSRAMPSSASTLGRLESLKYEPKSSKARDDSVRDSWKNLQPSQLIVKEAGSRVPIEAIVATYKEKRKVMQDRFPDEKEEWQSWFVEATVWSQLFGGAPFPHSEPRYYHRPGDNGHIANPAFGGHFETYAIQEAVMERMALQRGIRKEFYQYLNSVRHVARAVFPICSCYAKNFFSDRLTWRKFFKEPFPIPWPSEDHKKSCSAYVPTNSRSVQSPAVISSKSPTSKVEGREYRGSQPPTGLEKPRQHTPKIKSEEHETMAVPPRQVAAVDKALSTGANIGSKSRRSEAGWGAATVVSLQPPPSSSSTSQKPGHVTAGNVRSQKLEPRNASHSSESASTRRLMQSLGPNEQGTNIHFTSAQISLQPPQSKTSTAIGARLQSANTENASKELLEPTVKVSHEIVAPVSIMTALMDLRRGNSIPDGAVVMQNMDSTICKTENVTQMARYLLAESAASITSISNGLKCHFRYKQIWNGDLILWVEPYSLGDTVAFSGGHLFLKGWVQRNWSFGVVKPSFYWNEIKNHPGFKQAAMSPPPKLCEASPNKSERGSSTPSEKARGGVTNKTEKENETALIIRGSYLESIPCSSTALKSLVYSFFIDKSKEKVERRLRCTLSLSEPANKSAGNELQLEVKRVVATDGDVFNKATRFLHAWAVRAMKPALCKPSAFLICPEGLQILGKSEPAVLVSDDSGEHSHGREKTESAYNVSDLDLLLSEEAAKVEGPSRLVLDDITGDVVTLRELLRKTLERASAKMLESSVPPSPRPLLTPNSTEGEEDEEYEDDEDEVRVFGTDGQMKDMGGGRFVVIKCEKQVQVSGFVTAKRKLQEDQDFGTRAEKKVCVSMEMDIVRKGGYELDPDAPKPAEKTISGSVTEVVEFEKLEEVVATPPVDIAESPKQAGAEESAATPSEDNSRAAEVSESAKGKRKAEEPDPEDHAEKKVCV